MLPAPAQAQAMNAPDAPTASASAPAAPALADALAAFGAGRVGPADLREIQCSPAAAEEPTEHECRWEQRTARGWYRYASWLAHDGRGWTLLEDPLPVPRGDDSKLRKAL
ncbi:hypothetical protein [Sphingobium lignivorans]|uniref:Uncharacterized protein n=1 Tax=Sphingobium lignivorans TaxID=2735886 RepID=A0ABR6NB51_9SPHN|nr:hypothetical protein [Sphingobium lignivorans]MBB5984506.1 hypothetical protein [Sphingobium lignivorans]